MSGETYPYFSDPITADSFLHPLPSPLDNRIAEGGGDADSLFNWMEAMQPYGLEATLSHDSLFYPSQDCYQLTEPFFSSESELLWQQLEEPLSFGPEPDYQPEEFDFPVYPLNSYQQLSSTQPSSSNYTSTTPSSQNSSSPEQSPNSQAETREKNGMKRRTNPHNSDHDAHVVSRKRVRGQEYNITRSHLDHGYESMSPETNISSPIYVSNTSLVSEHTSTQLNCPELVGSVTRAIDGMIDKFSKSQVKLSTEEIEALQVAGLPIPTTLPLTKVEQNALRDVRRRLKNKQAAMENRRKKKEYVSDLETQVEDYKKTVCSFEERLKHVEREKQVLETELRNLRSASRSEKDSRSVSVQTGACLMVFVLCFGLVFGTWFTGFGQLGDTALYQKNIRHSLTSRTLLNSPAMQQTTFHWISDFIVTSYNSFCSFFDFSSGGNYASILDLAEEANICHNHSCAPH